jgi:hypothetical protein
MRIRAGDVVTVRDDVSVAKTFVLERPGQELPAMHSGDATVLRVRDPRHGALAGASIGMRRMFQFGGRVRGVEIQSVERLRVDRICR